MSSLLMTSSPGRSGTLPVEHLDYIYIQQCGDLTYLEKILHVLRYVQYASDYMHSYKFHSLLLTVLTPHLRSGTEGLYPHLVDFCEKRIESLDPKHHALRKDSCMATAASLTTEEWKHITEDLQV